MIDFIKDADCTKETPVKLGVPDAPIYGKGIKLKPRVDGRTDSEHFKKIYLPELLPLEEYDLIVVLISGGKDSVACYLKLLELGVPKERIEFWHHDIDGGHPSRRMDWKCTQNYVKALADAEGIKLRVSYRVNGFFGELYRIGASEPIEWIDPDTGEVKQCKLSSNYLKCKELKEQATEEMEELLKKYGYRMKFPAKTGDLSRRWCSAYLKICVADTVVSNLDCLGELEELGGKRHKFPAKGGTHSGRWCSGNLKAAVQDSVTANLEETKRDKKILIVSGERRGESAGVKELFPDDYAALRHDEEVLGFTLDNKKNLDEFIGDTQSCVCWKDKAAIHSILGFVFKQQRTKDKIITVTAYDQLRYLKNKDTKVYEGKTANQFVKMIADDYALNLGTLDDTGYVIESRVEENTSLFEMIANALDLTLTNTGEMYVLYDDFGKLTLKSLSSMYVGVPGAYLMIDEETGQNFDYTSSIDENTYNKIKLTYDNKDTGKRDVYITQDSSNINKWGILQYFDTLQKGENGQAKADALLKLYNKKTRNLKITNALGDNRVRAGSMVVINLDLGDVKLKNWMLVEKCKHTYKEGEHWMDLTLRGGEFVA